MQAGLLNRRIEIQQQEQSSDSFGQQIDQWNTIHKCWAEIKNVRGREIVASATFVGKVYYEITVRYSPSFVFHKEHRVFYKEGRSGVCHKYEIEAVVNVNLADNTVLLLCYELDGNS